MRYALRVTTRFKKSLKRAKKRGLPLQIMTEVIECLQNGKPLDSKYRDHELIGAHKGHRECHLQADWLLIYYLEEQVLTLTLVDTGSHADLFHS